MAAGGTLSSAPDRLRCIICRYLCPRKMRFLRRFLTLLLLLLLVTKVAAVLARGPVAIEMDAFGYWRFAALVMSGDVLMLSEPIAFRTPLYPYFVSIVRAITGDGALLSIVVLQGLLSVASIGIAGRLAVRMTKLPNAMPLTLLASLPAVSALTFSAAVLSETLFIFLMMLNLLAVMNYARSGSKWSVCWLGLTFAAALLTRPIIILLWIPHLLFVLLIHFRRWRRLRKTARTADVKLHHRVGHAALAAATIGLLISPWLLRNQHLFGSPFVTEFVGRNVWIVTFQDGSGAGLELPDTPAAEKLQWRLANVKAQEHWRDTWSVSDALVRSGLNDAQADRLMRSVATDAILVNRQVFAEKAVRRIVNFWRCTATDLPAQGAKGNYRRQFTWARVVPPVDIAMKYRLSQSVWGNTALAALIGAATILLIINFPTRPYGIWLLLIFSYFAVVTGVLEIPAYRYRIVIEPLAALTIGAAGAVLLSWRRKPAALEVAK